MSESSPDSTSTVMATPRSEHEDSDAGDVRDLFTKLSLEPYPSDGSIKGSEGGAGGGDRTISIEALQPLQNPLILKHLFERWPWYLLKTIRQVCKLWRDLSREAWLSSCTTAVRENWPSDFYDDEEDFVQEISWTVSHIPFQKFVEHVDKYCPRPIRNIKLEAFEFRMESYVGGTHRTNCLRRNEAVDQLWELCGNGTHLTTLELYFCSFTDVAQFRNLIYKFCTNLQHLKLTTVHLYGNADPDPDRNLLTAFTHVASDDGKQVNLKSLYLDLLVYVREHTKYTNIGPDSLIPWSELLPYFSSCTSLKLKIDAYGDRGSKAKADRLSGEIHLRRLSDHCPRLSSDFQESFDKEPFHHMEVKGVTFGSSHDQLVNMWRLSGSGKYLAILELDNCKFPSVQEFRNIIYTSCSNLRQLKLTDCEFPPLPAEDRRIPSQYIEPEYERQFNLRSLKVSHSYTYEYRPHLPVTWLEILSHFPCLTSLEVELIGEGAATFPQFEIIRILEAIRLVREDDDGLQLLRSFQLRPHLPLSSPDIVSDKIIRFLHKLQLSLEKLVIKVDPEKKSGPAALENVLEFNRGTLTSLSVHAGKADGLPLPHWNFPCHGQLANLDSLEICGLLCSNLEFLKVIPNLRKLCIYEIHCGRFIGGNSDIVANTSKSAMANVKLVGLKSFHLDSVISLEDLAWLIDWMPRLGELTLPLDNEQFTLVCKHCRYLEKLTVLGNELTDGGVIGIKWEEEEGNSGAATPNITDLQDLGRLRLFTEHLTDSSIFNGFGQLPKLWSIWTFGKSMKLSHAARRCLKKKTVLWEQFDEDDPVALNLLE